MEDEYEFQIGELVLLKCSEGDFALGKIVEHDAVWSTEEYQPTIMYKAIYLDRFGNPTLESFTGRASNIKKLV